MHANPRTFIDCFCSSFRATHKKRVLSPTAPFCPRTIFNYHFSFCLPISFSYHETFCLLSTRSIMICGVCKLNNPLNSFAWSIDGKERNEKRISRSETLQLAVFCILLFNPYMDLKCLTLTASLSRDLLNAITRTECDYIPERYLIKLYNCFKKQHRFQVTALMLVDLAAYLSTGLERPSNPCI